MAASVYQQANVCFFGKRLDTEDEMLRPDVTIVDHLQHWYGSMHEVWNRYVLACERVFILFT